MKTLLSLIILTYSQDSYSNAETENVPNKHYSKEFIENLKKQLISKKIANIFLEKQSPVRRLSTGYEWATKDDATQCQENMCRFEDGTNAFQYFDANHNYCTTWECRDDDGAALGAHNCYYNSGFDGEKDREWGGDHNDRDAQANVGGGIESVCAPGSMISPTTEVTTTACMSCPQGWYNPTPHGNCIKTPLNHVTNYVGSCGTNACGDGTYAPKGWSECFSCPLGKRKNYDGGGCIGCPTGKRMAELGKPCNAAVGSYLKEDTDGNVPIIGNIAWCVDTATNCLLHDGTRAASAQDWEDDVSYRWGGTWADFGTGTSSWTDKIQTCCALGGGDWQNFYPGDDSTNWESCPPGFYCPGNGRKEPCGNGKWCSGTSGTRGKNGYKGVDINGNNDDHVDSTECKIGHFCARAHGPVECQLGSLCGVGEFSDKETKNYCLAGKICGKGVRLGDCLAGDYCPAAIRHIDTTKVPCTPGYYCPAGNMPEACPVGTFSDPGCTQQLPIKKSDGSFETNNYNYEDGCHPCPAGYFCDCRGADGQGGCGDPRQTTKYDESDTTVNYGTLQGNSQVSSNLLCADGYYCPTNVNTGEELVYGSITPFTYECVIGHRCGSGSISPYGNTSIWYNHLEMTEDYQIHTGGPCYPGMFCPSNWDVCKENPYTCLTDKYNNRVYDGENFGDGIGTCAPWMSCHGQHGTFPVSNYHTDSSAMDALIYSNRGNSPLAVPSPRSFYKYNFFQEPTYKLIKITELSDISTYFAPARLANMGYYNFDFLTTIVRNSWKSLLSINVQDSEDLYDDLVSRSDQRKVLKNIFKGINLVNLREYVWEEVHKHNDAYIAIMIDLPNPCRIQKVSITSVNTLLTAHDADIPLLQAVLKHPIFDRANCPDLYSVWINGYDMHESFTNAPTIPPPSTAYPTPSPTTPTTTAPTTQCSSGTMDGDETDIDCGGSLCPRCKRLDECNQDSDCESTLQCRDFAVMDMGDSYGTTYEEKDSWFYMYANVPRVCLAPTNAPTIATTAPPATQCISGTMDGDETDVDCGGSCSPCSQYDKCLTVDDCEDSLICRPYEYTGDVDFPGSDQTLLDDYENTYGTIQTLCLDPTNAPTTAPPTLAVCSNGVRDGLETEVDCGGGVCPGCAGGKTCVNDSDCNSDTCLENNICAVAPTSTPTTKHPTTPPTKNPTLALPPPSSAPVRTDAPTVPPTDTPTNPPPSTAYPTNPPATVYSDLTLTGEMDSTQLSIEEIVIVLAIYLGVPMNTIKIISYDFQDVSARRRRLSTLTSLHIVFEVTPPATVQYGEVIDKIYSEDQVAAAFDTSNFAGFTSVTSASTSSASTLPPSPASGGTSDTSDDSGSSLGPIIGGAVGGVLLIGGIAAYLLLGIGIGNAESKARVNQKYPRKLRFNR